MWMFLPFESSSDVREKVLQPRRLGLHLWLSAGLLMYCKCRGCIMCPVTSPLSTTSADDTINQTAWIVLQQEHVGFVRVWEFPGFVCLRRDYLEVVGLLLYMDTYYLDGQNRLHIYSIYCIYWIKSISCQVRWLVEQKSGKAVPHTIHRMMQITLWHCVIYMDLCLMFYLHCSVYSYQVVWWNKYTRILINRCRPSEMLNIVGSKLSASIHYWW